MKFSLAQNEKHALLGRTILALAFILIAAALRVAPHPWNFTPIGAMALFSGAVLKDRRLAFGFPLLALFAGDLFTGLYNYRLMLIVYASFALSVAIGFWLRDSPHRRPHQRRDSSWCPPVLPRHQLRRLGHRPLLSTQSPRARQMLSLGHPLLLEHFGWRRLLRFPLLRCFCFSGVPVSLLNEKAPVGSVV